jgi:hypothetical protein
MAIHGHSSLKEPEGAEPCQWVVWRALAECWGVLIWPRLFPAADKSGRMGRAGQGPGLVPAA